MIRLRLAHLYPDLLNLYGDFGNLLALKHRATGRGYAVEYLKIGLGERLDPQAFDLLFIGGGQDQQQKAVLTDLLNDKKGPLLEAAERGIPMLGICGGYQLMGQRFETAKGELLEGVGWLPVETRGESPRLIGDVVARATGLTVEAETDSYLIGFENHSGRTYLLEGATPLAQVVPGQGSGNNGQDGTEGCRRGSVIGTYLHGSFLPKNPAVTDWLLHKALLYRGEAEAFTPLDAPLEQFARQLELKRLEKLRQKGS